MRAMRVLPAMRVMRATRAMATTHALHLVRNARRAVESRPRGAISVVTAAALTVATVGFVGLRSREHFPKLDKGDPSGRASDTSDVTSQPAARLTPPSSALSGLDLQSISIDDSGAVAAAARGRIAKLTLEPRLQNAAQQLLSKHKLPQGAIVMIEPSTGKVLAYASRGGEGHDLAVEANAPSASVFKMVTGAALVQVAGVSPDLKTCYSGGEQKILAVDLKDDPKRDTYCATLGQALGRSINTVFARLAAKKLSPTDLSTIAAQLGYGTPIPFDVPVSVSKIDLPTDPLGFARTAAGFWNTTLSPLHGALLAATVANGGVTMRPFVVSEVLDGTTSLYKAPQPSAWRKAIEPTTAATLEKMMVETVSQGTSYKAFHDAKGKAFLPGIEVAGKTGTLNQSSPVKLFTWFVGFAPVQSPKVAIAALVVNDPVWKVKANVLAREVLQFYFAEQGSTGVTAPTFD
ncbi:MAG: hypothetical protein NVS3B20_01650 [Polyangiales bacterium]